jgi:predicted RNase H-like HicB family nuclease
MKLSIHIWQSEQGGYKASCPMLPGCMSEGSTKKQALSNLQEAIRGYMAAVNNFVPEEDLVGEVVEQS